MSEEITTAPSGAPAATGQASGAAAELTDLNRRISDTQTATEAAAPSAPAKTEATPAAATQSADEFETLGVEDLRKRSRELAKQSQNQKMLIDRFGNEIGELRKSAQGLLSQQNALKPAVQGQPQEGQGLPEVDGAEFVTNPMEAYRKLQARVAAEDQLRQQKEMLATQIHAQTNRGYLDKVVPEHAEMANDLYELFKTDMGGNAPVDAQTFQQRIYQEAPGTVLNMVRRAQLQKQVAELTKRAADAEEKYDKLFKTVKGGHGGRPTVTGTSGGATKAAVAAPNMDRLSARDQLAQLNAILASQS